MENEEEVLKGYTMEGVVKFLENRFREADKKRSLIERQRKEYHVD